MATIPDERRRVAALRIVGICALILFLEQCCAGEERPGKNSLDVFPTGETLVYEVQWDPPGWFFLVPTITAGELTFVFQGPTEHKGAPAFKVTASAVSSGFFPKMAGITVTDSFESIVSAPEFCSLQMSKKIREGKRQRDVLLTFDQANGQSRYEAYDMSKNPPAELKNELVKNIPVCVQDLLSAVYYTRLQDLKIGSKVRFAVSDNGVVRNIEVRVDKQEMLDSVLGRCPVLKTEAVSVFGGVLQSSGTLHIWVSNDERKLPLKFEAKVKLGRVFGTAKKIERPGKS
jgi:hypothetical protein